MEPDEQSPLDLATNALLELPHMGGLRFTQAAVNEEARPPVEAPVAVPSEPAPIMLFPRTPSVVSRLSGKAMHPLQAEECPACNNFFEVKEMVNCETCGVPSCSLCTEGEHGPCPACDALETVDREDARLAFVFDRFPELGLGKRRWEAATVGQYILCHWSYLGTWGLVVLHKMDAHAAPTLLTEFRCGRLETIRQVMTGWWG